MPTIHLTTTIDAPTDHVFDLARSVDFHTESMSITNETAVDGVTSGLLSSGDRVTWRARHFGIPFTLTVKITKFDYSNHFRDIMIDGPFAEQIHDHYFEPVSSGTQMIDVFQFSSPFGVVGTIVDILYLERYLRRLLTVRNNHLRQVAESDEW